MSTGWKFDPGECIATPGALEAIRAGGHTAREFVSRHASGDWGIVGEGDRESNDRALESGDVILSAYQTSLGVKLWVVTEAAGGDGKRASTTVMLPDEY